MRQVKDTIVILGIDTIRRKNIYQIDCINNNNFSIVIFTNDIMGGSERIVGNKGLTIKLSRSFAGRIVQVYKFLMKNRRNIHHVEIYPGGRFSIFYLIIAKMLGIKTVVVERGDLLYWEDYTLYFRFILRLLYKYSDIVWYKEPYMERLLDSIGCRSRYFLYNCVDIEPINVPKHEERDIDFLWVNRFIKGRNPEWLLRLASEMPEYKFVLLGYMKDSVNKDIIEKQSYFSNVGLDNLMVIEYTNPVGFYIRSKFFLLPAEIVFLNHSLLEAMSYGCIPIISNSEGSDLIVEDGVDGFIHEHSYESFKNKILKILSDRSTNFNCISENARLKVKSKFSCDKWCHKYMEMINSLYKN